MTFTAGHPGYKPKGSGGRQKVLQMLDSLIGDDGRLDILKQKLVERFDADPVAYYKEFVRPLLPREMKLELDTTEKLGMRLLLGDNHEKENKGEVEGKMEALSQGCEEGKDIL